MESSRPNRRKQWLSMFLHGYKIWKGKRCQTQFYRKLTNDTCNRHSSPTAYFDARDLAECRHSLKYTTTCFVSPHNQSSDMHCVNIMNSLLLLVDHSAMWDVVIAMATLTQTMSSSCDVLFPEPPLEGNTHGTGDAIYAAPSTSSYSTYSQEIRWRHSCRSLFHSCRRKPWSFLATANCLKVT